MTTTTTPDPDVEVISLTLAEYDERIAAAREEALKEAKQIVRRSIAALDTYDFEAYKRDDRYYHGVRAAAVQSINALDEALATPSTPQPKDADAIRYATKTSTGHAS